jgi:hypothetical protein
MQTMPLLEGVGEIIMEFIFEPVLYYIFSIPGAFFRFLISRLWRSKRSLESYLTDGAFYNGFVGLFGFMVIGLIIFNLN